MRYLAAREQTLQLFLGRGSDIWRILSNNGHNGSIVARILVGVRWACISDFTGFWRKGRFSMSMLSRCGVYEALLAHT